MYRDYNGAEYIVDLHIHADFVLGADVDDVPAS